VGVRLDMTIGAVDRDGPGRSDPWSENEKIGWETQQTHTTYSWSDTVTTTTAMWGQAPEATAVFDAQPIGSSYAGSCPEPSAPEVGELHWTVFASSGRELSFHLGYPFGRSVTTEAVSQLDRIFGERTAIERDVDSEHDLLDGLHVNEDPRTDTNRTRWLDPVTGRITHFGADGDKINDTAVPPYLGIPNATRVPSRTPVAVITAARNGWSALLGSAIGVGALGAISRGWYVRRRREPLRS